jgi:hypothetical protein
MRRLGRSRSTAAAGSRPAQRRQRQPDLRGQVRIWLTTLSATSIQRRQILPNQGLQRSLRMASFLQQDVLGEKNVSAIYAVVPTTHPQTANQYPDMVGLETIEQFAMLNQITLSYESNTPVPASSYPVNVSYSSAALPDGVAQPFLTCPTIGSGTYVQLPGAGFQRPGRRQRNPGKRYRQGKRAGILCFLGAVGNRQHPDGKHQQARRVQA